MRDISVQKITDALVHLVRSACLSLAPGVVERLRQAEQNEENQTARFALKTLIDNAELAASNAVPVCQDTGMAVVFAEIGQDVRFVGGSFTDAVNEGVRRGYKEFFLRNSVLDPITRKNTGDNTPAIIHTSIVLGDKVKLTLLPKGFGSENMSKLYMLTPAAGVAGVMDKVVEAVFSAGSNPCPPIIVGVGIGGTADYAMLLAKKALLRDVGVSSADPQLAEMEQILLTRINDLGIGAQGFGGKTTALEVRIEKHPTHIAALPVGVAIQCNAHRVARTEVL
ncbi:MAG: fumarate hydratase [Clostridiales bacterium]|nr:fumarate hydratase [Clostridiales bacterium]